VLKRLRDRHRHDAKHLIASSPTTWLASACPTEKTRGSVGREGQIGAIRKIRVGFLADRPILILARNGIVAASIIPRLKSVVSMSSDRPHHAAIPVRSGPRDAGGHMLRTDCQDYRWWHLAGRGLFLPTRPSCGSRMLTCRISRRAHRRDRCSAATR